MNTQCKIAAQAVILSPARDFTRFRQYVAILAAFSTTFVLRVTMGSKPRRRRNRIPKTLNGMLRDLDDHMYLLRQNIAGLANGELAHVKQIAAELRVLTCCSSGTEGLLFRLADELNISDVVFVSSIGEVNRDSPLAKGLEIFVPAYVRGEHARPNAPRCRLPLRDVIRNHEALHLSQVCPNERITHEKLIRKVAEQMGSAHEDEGIDFDLTRLLNTPLVDLPPFVAVLRMNADFSLEVGERILAHAESNLQFVRKRRMSSSGRSTIAVRFTIQDVIAGKIEVFRFRSFICDVSITCCVRPRTVGIDVARFGEPLASMEVEHSDDDTLVVVTYSSNMQRMTVALNDSEDVQSVDVNLGWIEACELENWSTQESTGMLNIHFIALWSRFFSVDERRALWKKSVSELGYEIALTNEANRHL